MSGTPLVLDSAVRKEIRDLCEFAAAQRVDIVGLAERIKTPEGKAAHMAQMTRQTVRIPLAYLATFSIETGHPCGTCRHLSLSVTKAGRAPNLDGLWFVAREFGFLEGLRSTWCNRWTWWPRPQKRLRNERHFSRQPRPEEIRDPGHAPGRHPGRTHRGAKRQTGPGAVWRGVLVAAPRGYIHSPAPMTEQQIRSQLATVFGFQRMVHDCLTFYRAHGTSRWLLYQELPDWLNDPARASDLDLLVPPDRQHAPVREKAEWILRERGLWDAPTPPPARPREQTAPPLIPPRWVHPPK